MNPELEELILLYEAAFEARGQEAGERMTVFENRVKHVLERHPGLSGDSLRRSIIKAHRNWVLKQNRPSSIPPGS